MQRPANSIAPSAARMGRLTVLPRLTLSTKPRTSAPRVYSTVRLILVSQPLGGAHVASTPDTSPATGSAVFDGVSAVGAPGYSVIAPVALPPPLPDQPHPRLPRPSSTHWHVGLASPAPDGQRLARACLDRKEASLRQLKAGIDCSVWQRSESSAHCSCPCQGIAQPTPTSSPPSPSITQASVSRLSLSPPPPLHRLAP